MPWNIYILECKDSKLYTGITKDLVRRMREHRSGHGCRFTKYRTPVKLRYSESCATRSEALRREAKIKSFPRKSKLLLIKARKPKITNERRIRPSHK